MSAGDCCCRSSRRDGARRVVLARSEIVKVPVAERSGTGPYPHVRDVRRAGRPTELRTRGGIRTPIHAAFEAAASAVRLLGQVPVVALQAEDVNSTAATRGRCPAN